MTFSKRISRIPKSGIREIFNLTQKMSGVTSLAIGEPDFNTPQNIKEAAKKALDEDFTRYTPNAGIPELREAISQKMKSENNVNADPEKEVMVTAGTSQAIFLLSSVIVEEGDEVLIPSPAFVAYAPDTYFAGGIPREVPMVEDEGYRVDVEALKKKISKKSKLIILNSPCNPTGSVLSRRNIKEIVDLAVEHDLYIISDEVYEKYLYEGEHFSPASLEGMKDHVITINGFSKTYAMTGWRIGYIIARQDIINEATKLQMYNAVCPVSFVQKAAIQALRGSQTFLKEVIDECNKKRHFVCKRLNEMDSVHFVEPMGAFYIFPHLLMVTDSEKFCKELLVKTKVAIIPGNAFGTAGEGHVRISYATGMERLQNGLERLSNFLRIKEL